MCEWRPSSGDPGAGSAQARGQVEGQVVEGGDQLTDPQHLHHVL